MKIAVFTDVFLDVPGGIPSSIKAQKKGLEALGHSVTIFAPGFENSLRNLSEKEQKDIVLVPTHALLKPNGAPLAKRPELVEREVLIRFPEFDFDVVHVHYEASCSIAGMLLARKFGRLLVQTMHGREDMAVQINIPFPLKTLVASVLCFLHSRYIPHKLKIKPSNKVKSNSGSSIRAGSTLSVQSDLAPTLARAKMWEIMINHASFADEIVMPARHFADKFKKMGLTKEVNIVSNGIEDEMVERFDEKAKKLEAADELNDGLVRKVKEGEELRIFWNSRLSNEKRIMPFLEALKLMEKSCVCSFVGDGNALNKAKRFAAKHNLNVKFYGRVSHDKVLDMMLKQHISAIASYGFDNQSMTLLEAEATGTPVFFCDPDMKGIVPSGGFVMASGPSPVDMAQALDMIVGNPERIEKMSQVMLKHRKDVLQSTQIRKLMKVYGVGK